MDRGLVMRRCLFAFAISAAAWAAPAAKDVTFHKHVEAILQARCQQCHRPGEVAPMSLLTYKDARPWAKAIKEAVLVRKMPPWFADPGHGQFSNDRRLSQPRLPHPSVWRADGGRPRLHAPHAGRC